MALVLVEAIYPKTGRWRSTRISRRTHSFDSCREQCNAALPTRRSLGEKMKNRTLRFGFALALTASFAFAQTKQVRPVQKARQRVAPAPSAPLPMYVLTEFDSTSRTLPPLFKGHDVTLVYSALEERKKQSEKSEFETTLQWHQRQDRLLLEPVIGLRRR
jgi:hypothetical protein